MREFFEYNAIMHNKLANALILIGAAAYITAPIVFAYGAFLDKNYWTAILLLFSPILAPLGVIFGVAVIFLLFLGLIALIEALTDL